MGLSSTSNTMKERERERMNSIQVRKGKEKTAQGI
jgi:hypothetical protein